jgi:prophage regulatory protein
MNQTEILELREIIGGGSSDPTSKGLFPVSRSTWYRGIRAGIYPRGIRLSPRRVGWYRFQIDSLIRTLEAQSCESPKSVTNSEEDARRASANGDNP